MWKLIKMDFYRLLSSKTFKVGAILSAIMSVLYIFFSLGIMALTKFALGTDPTLAANLGTLLSQAGWMNGVDFAEIVFRGTSALTLFVGCMIASSFIGSEQSCGYVKNFAGQLPNKGYMAVSKFVVTSFAQFMILFIYTGVCSALAFPVFGKYITGYDLKSLFWALGLRLMLHLAINAIIIFVCALAKSHAIAMVAGCVLGLGITEVAYTVVSLVLRVVNIKFFVSDYMPDGINSQLSLSSLGDLSLKAIFVSIGFMIVFLIANYYVLSKRDVK